MSALTTFEVTRQESYSRVQLLLRTFFGFFYIIIPHAFILFFLGIAFSVLNMVNWFVLLFTGRYPKGIWEYNLKYFRWNLRLTARLFNLADGYHAFGLDAQDEATELNLEYQGEYNRITLLLRTFFGFFYIYLPHSIAIYFRMIATSILSVIAWFAVLFTGKYPEGIFNFNVGTLRWMYRLQAVFYHMIDTYPPFSGKPTAE